ncbi:MCE family protein [Nocardia sp. N2S4-5]|uniref:MCE family protein n=1 Tax=Nocardia sp. N2S4-5 TaxID=3351565 RepID=UPI0037D50072
MTRLSRPAKLAFLGAAAAVVAAASVPVTRMGNTTINVVARFDNAAGLYAGNPVDVLGMRVGEISGIVQRGTYIDVTMSIDKSVPIPADAMAVTVSDSVLTDRHIEFTPAYRGGPTLPDGAVLDTGRTRTPIEFDSVLAMADKLSRSLAGDGRGNGPVADIVGVGASVATGNNANLKAALDQLSRALRRGNDSGAATQDAITKIVNNLNTLSAAAAGNDQKIRDFGSAVHQMSTLLADLNLGTGDTGTELVEILTATTDLMEKNRDALRSTATGADVLFKSLADYNRNIAEFLDVFPLVTDNAYRVIDQEAGAARVHANVDKIALDGQMVKEVCNLLGLKQLGCDTGKASDMGPDFGVVAMLAGIAGLPE